jgi:hypothetical protein
MREIGAMPFFIIGSQRSGTTLLRLILNAHSEIAIPEEGTFWMPLLRSLKGRYNEPIPETSLNRYINYIEKNDQFRAWFMRGCSLSELLKGGQSVSLRILMNAVYEEYARVHSKKMWGDKTPSFFRMVNELSSFFPEAKFINVIRDGRDVYLSLKDREKGRKNIAVAALEWRHKVQKVKKSFSRFPSDRVLNVRFEDILTDPERRTKDICAFLGIRFEDRMLQFYKTSHKFIGEHHSERIFRPISAEAAGKWKGKLSVGKNRIYELIAYDCLRENDYPIVSEGRFGIADRIKAALLLTGLVRRGFQVLATAFVLLVSSRLGLRTSAAGGKRYLENK